MNKKLGRVKSPTARRMSHATFKLQDDDLHSVAFTRKREIMRSDADDTDISFHETRCDIT